MDLRWIPSREGAEDNELEVPRRRGGMQQHVMSWKPGQWPRHLRRACGVKSKKYPWKEFSMCEMMLQRAVLHEDRIQGV